MLATRLPRSCFGLRCKIETSCPAFSSSFTKARPMNSVPPITRTFKLDPLLVLCAFSRSTPRGHTVGTNAAHSRDRYTCLRYTNILMLARATTISTLIVDDEQLASDELSYLLKDFPDIEVVATGRNGLEALRLIEDLEPDLVFLDVQMPGLDGLGVIQKLHESDANIPHFILATAYDQYAL